MERPDTVEMPEIGATVDIVIEIPRGSRVKRRPDGSLDYASPLPVPFDYGSVPGVLSGDGDPLDAIVLGGPRPPGHRLRTVVRAVVPFVDAGRPDPKLVCADDPLTPADVRLVERFFVWFGRLKWAVNAMRGAPGPTRAGSLQIRRGPGMIEGP